MKKESNLSELEREIISEARADEEDFKCGWDGDWSKVIDQYNGAR